MGRDFLADFYWLEEQEEERERKKNQGVGSVNRDGPSQGLGVDFDEIEAQLMEEG